MKRNLLIGLLLNMAVSYGFAQEELPQWAKDLMTKNPNFIDSIYYYNANENAPDTRTYVIYYHQPMNHSQLGSPVFPMRALITVFRDADPTTAVNHVYASGYNIEGLYEPDSVFLADKNDCSTEIAWRYRANYIQIEHRYFLFSAPDECWTKLDDLRAEEAAADFHNLFEALKKVLKGKYVMSGVSKGGITTLLQHKFYPNDMDIFVPYSAPFFDTDRDLEMQKYWYTTGWSKEFQDMFMDIRRKGIAKRNLYFPIYAKMSGGTKTQAAADSLFCSYLNSICIFGFDDHAYNDTLTIRKQMRQNDSIMRAKGMSGYNDTVYTYMIFKGKYTLKDFPKWLDTLRKYPDKKQAPIRYERHLSRMPFGITYEQWTGDDSIKCEAYSYQSKRELGYFDFRFDLIVENPDSAQMWNNHWVQNAGCSRDLASPFYRTLTFSRTLYDETMSATQNATKPIVLIYGLDDTWTGAAVKDKYINGTNVRKFILPAQNHLVNFCSNTDKTQCDAIRAILDGVLGAPQAIDRTDAGTETKAVKILRDGQIYILRGEKVYTLQGIEVK